MLEPTMQRRPVDQANVYGHPARPTSTMYSQQHPQQHQHLQHPGHPFQHSRRSPSVNTFSTTSSMAPPAAYRKSSASDLRRSISSRSGGTTGGGSGYVALLRKQKATVWCDRAQYEDPQSAARQRAAKQRANLEVIGGRGSASAGGSRTNTGISTTGKVAAKIRHHGKGQPVVGLTPGENHVGVGGVPLRLSATEVEAESSDDEPSTSRLHHRRTGSSGRSSNASGRRGLAYRTSGHGSMNSRHSTRWTPGDTPERPGSLIEHQQPQQGQQGDVATEDSGSGKAQSTHSASDAEKADNVGELSSAPRMASNSLLHSALTREKSVKNPEELKRRGSIDERTSTLTSQRLYIANPD